MSAEQFGGFEPPKPIQEQAPRPHEKLKGFHKELWERAQNVFERAGLSIPADKEQEIVERIQGVENKNEEDKFLNFEVERGGEELNLRLVAQIDKKYDPDRKKNYDKWDLTPEEEAVRWLQREIHVGRKFNKFFKGESVMADEEVEANPNPNQRAIFLLKRVKGQEKAPEEYGEVEGQALARTLLSMQDNLDATAMIKEIMAEEGIETKLEMEQKVLEDYFDHFAGYMENSRAILGDLDDEELAKIIEEKMESYRETIEGRQLNEDEYGFVHGQVNLETVRFSPDGRALLSDWQMAGKTQNRELSIVYDLGNIYNDAVERFASVKQMEEFIRGTETAIREHYQEDTETAEAIINLAKLRSFSMILNEVEGEKREFVGRELEL